MTTMLTPLVSAKTPSTLAWRNLPDLPKALGGHFAGVAGEHVLVAGGSYFDSPPWAGGRKQRVDTIYALPPDESRWHLSGKLPFQVASGAAITTPRGLLCTGGQLPDGSSKQCLLLRIRNGNTAIERWPDLPQTLSMHAGACDGENAFIAGGQETAESTTSLRLFWRLNLSQLERGWQRLPDLPECGRILPLLAASPGAVYLISGAELTGAPGPPAGRRFMADAFRFTSKVGWQRIAAPPRAVQGGSALGRQRRILVFSGNDGGYAAREYEVRDRHPGFSKDVLAYDPVSDSWAKAGTMPLSLVTTAAAPWKNGFVIPGGEVRPAHRSAKVFAGYFEE